MSDGSVYEALAAQNLAIHHGVASISPTIAADETADRLKVPAGSLLLTLFQVDSTALGEVVLVSLEHHLACAFDFSVYRRGPGERGEPPVSDDLVVGVDVGSQGTCAEAIAADGSTVASSYVPHATSCPHPGWAEQDPQQWLRAVARALDEVRRSVARTALRAITFGSPARRPRRRTSRRLTGWTRADLDGPARPASNATRRPSSSRRSGCAS